MTDAVPSTPSSIPSGLGHDRYCSEIVTQTALVRSCVEGTDLTAPVHTCPGWNVAQLLRHLGGSQRWAEETVRTRAQGPLPDDHFRDIPPDPPADPGALLDWLVAGATLLAGALRDAGPDAAMWTPVPGAAAAFYARRFTHETVVHRADAALAVGAPFTVAEDVALDCIDEWMELGSLPLHLEVHPWMRELLGAGRTIHLHATDTAPQTRAEWLIDLTGDAITWRRAHEKATVAIRAPLTDLLLIVFRRRPARGEGIEILGDVQFLDHWLERIPFG